MTIQRWVGLLVYVSIALSAIASFWLEKQRRVLMPGTRPYTWGIFVGLTSMSWGAFLCVSLIGMGVVQQGSHMVSRIVYAAFVGWVYAGSGYYMIQRRRIAFVIATLISMNPVWWIANTIYGWKRWTELTPWREPPLRDEHQQAV